MGALPLLFPSFPNGRIKDARNLLQGVKMRGQWVANCTSRGVLLQVTLH